MPIDPKRAETIFNAALALAPADRGAFLAAVCASDDDLRARIERLLAAHAELDAPPGTATFGDGTASAGAPPSDTEDYVPRPDAGTVIAGKYKLIEEVGAGGMGTVWMAQQMEPVKRVVAVKLIKAGMDSKAVLARFEAERQALALMDHPNIAKVLDAGATPDGRPFFVMELVKGVPITQYCDDRKLTPRQRLELFVPVCNAIQHAHQKGVIHRDIKPSNVLVALYDDKPVPKVIDFGIAKAAGQALTDMTLVTGFGAVVGTPEYMSPEQASLNNLDVDTRSDVYSLGVLLYELLTGTTPVDRKSLGRAAVLEVLRIVREVEAPRPSAKLSDADTLPSVAANRGTEPAKLSQLMKRELDWLVLKALEKDRARRYETASGFAADVQRYLAGESVLAVPPSRGYRLRKFYRRNRAALLTASAFVLVLAVTTGVSIWLAVWAIQAEREAKRSLDGIRATLAFVQDEVLAPAGPDDRTDFDPDLKMRTVLDRASARMDGRFPDQPQVEAILRRTIGRAYLGLGETGAAARHLERSAQLFEQVFSPTHHLAVLTRKELGMVYVTAGDDARAEQTLTAVADIDGRPGWEDDPVRQAAANMLVGVYRRQGRLAEAETLARRMIAVRRRTDGPDHPTTLRSALKLADVLAAQNRPAEAVAAHREALADHRRVFGDDNLETARVKYQLWLLLSKQGAEPEELSLLRDAADVHRRKLGENPRAAGIYYTCATQLGAANRATDAQPYILTALRTERRHPGCLKTDPHFVGAWALGKMLALDGQGELAEPVFREWLAVARSTTADELMDQADAESWLGFHLTAKKDYAGAEPFLLSAYRRLIALGPITSDRLAGLLPDAADRLVRFYEQTNRPADAAKWRAERAKYPPVAPAPPEGKR